MRIQDRLTTEPTDSTRYFLISAFVAASGVLFAHALMRYQKRLRWKTLGTLERRGVGGGPTLKSAEASRKLHRIWGEGTRDAVDQASWESFPASDPPAF